MAVYYTTLTLTYTLQRCDSLCLPHKREYSYNYPTARRAANRAKPNDFGPFSGYRAKLFTRVILGPAQRNYIEKGTLPPKSAPQNKIGLKFLLQNVEIFRRQPSPVSIRLSPIFSPELGVNSKISLSSIKNSILAHIEAFLVCGNAPIIHS